jgi:hypothetical protein
VVMAQQSCGNCKFWDAYEDGPALGICQRYPPVYTGRGDSEDNLERPSVFAFDQPTTMASEWCGEFQERASDAGQAES